jgi:hypothetical protein
VLRSIIFSASCFFLFACSPPTPVDCRVGADCASGVCLRDGTCQAVENTDSGTGGSGGGNVVGGGAGGGSAGGGNGGGSGGDAGTPDAGMPLGCLPNNDGRIDRSEVFFQAGLRATFKISGAATFDTAGTAAADGGRNWDFTQALSGDSSKLVETKSLQGQWFESEFPDGGYTTPVGSLVGVFSTTADALYLQGIVSPEADGGTDVKYEPWVKVLQFPLQAGATWTTDATVSGKYQGFVIGNAAFGTGLPFQREVYTSSVDRAGDAKTPFASFESLRVRTGMERYTRVYTLNPWYLLLTLRTFSWNTECFGTVASVTSTDNTTTTEFTSTAEVRRLSP